MYFKLCGEKKVSIATVIALQFPISTIQIKVHIRNILGLYYFASGAPVGKMQVPSILKEIQQKYFSLLSI